MKNDLQTTVQRIQTPRNGRDGLLRLEAPDKEPELTMRPSSSVVVKLPRLSVREFDGDPRKRRKFWNGFKAPYTSKNSSKLNYLISCLKSAALRTVEGCEISLENYSTVMDILMKKFGNSTIVKRALHTELKEVKRSDKDFD